LKDGLMVYGLTDKAIKYLMIDRQTGKN